MAWNALWTILGVMLVFLALGVPISYSIGISSLAAILATVSADAAVVTAAQRIFVGMSRFSLTAIPFFILAGNLMNQGGIAGRLVDLVLAVLGRLPGSLLVANVGANALFGAISGSASAAAAAVGSMVRDGEEEQGRRTGRKSQKSGGNCLGDLCEGHDPAQDIGHSDEKHHHTAHPGAVGDDTPERTDRDIPVADPQDQGV